MKNTPQKCPKPAITVLEPIESVSALPEPTHPGPVRWSAFESHGKVLATFGANRSDFNYKHHDAPERNVWRWTESNLLSLAYFAFCSDFRDSDLVWLFKQFLSKHSPDYPFLSERFYGLVANARAYFEKNGERSRQNAPEAQARKRSGRRKTHKNKGTGVRTRRVAELLARGWTVSEIARHLNKHVSTIQEQERLIKQLGGIAELFSDLREPFQQRLSRELFKLSRSHKHPLTARKADAIMAEVHEYAKRVGESSFLNLARLKRALRSRKSDSVEAIRVAIKESIADRVVRRRPSIRVLAEKLQMHKRELHLVFRNSNGIPMPFSARYATAVWMAYNIIERLRNSGAPKKVIGDAEWIWQNSKHARSFSKVFEAAADKFLSQKYGSFSVPEAA